MFQQIITLKTTKSKFYVATPRVGLIPAPDIASSCEQVAENFKRKPVKKVQPVLEALEALGRARLSDDNWELI